jgi:hypothetical protein
MLKAVLRYVPLIPLCAAVLLFLLMPFERAEEAGGELVHRTAMGLHHSLL